MSVGKISSKQTPLQAQTNSGESANPNPESEPKFVCSVIRSPSATFKAEAPAQLTVQTVLMKSANKSGVKSAQSGKSVGKDSAKKSSHANVSHFSPPHHTGDKVYDEHHVRSNQRYVRSGASSVDKNYRGGMEVERGYSAGRSGERKSPYVVGKSSLSKKSPARVSGWNEYEDYYSGPHYREGTDDVPNRSKYSVGEDLAILEYVQARPDAPLTSKSFWKHAVEVDDLLNGRRSIESIRERYRTHLRDLSDEEQHKMFLWYNHHDESGHANFARRQIKDEQGRLHYLSRFEGIEPDHRRKSSVSKQTVTIDSKEGVLKPGDPHLPEEEEYARVHRKRRDYDLMNQFADEFFPRKSYRDDYYDEDYGRTRNKEIWLRELAERYVMSPEQMTILYYNCNMDSDVLRRYLEGDRDLIWNNDEDILITGSQKEAAKRVLSRYKGTSNVVARGIFLRELDRLQIRPQLF